MNPNLEQWRKTILPINATIERAIQVLNEIGLRIILVADENGRLIGTVTDGDIRRGLLQNLTLNSTLAKILNREAISVLTNESRNKVLEIMASHRIQEIPIINSKKEIVGLHLWNELSSNSHRENIMVIMAGGKGTRLHPQTLDCPKPMLEVGGKPILLRIIERAKKQGFTTFCISIHHLGEVIEEYFKDGSSLGVEIQYVKENIPLGTAGALGLLNPRPTKAIVVTNGDLLTNINYGEMIEFHLSNNAEATMAVREFEMQNQFGVVKVNGLEIEGYEEKPIYRSYINAGVYIINPEVLSLIQPNIPYNMPDIFEELRLTGKKVIVYPMHESWIDVGSPEDFMKANLDKNKMFEEISNDRK
jgi:dTDP-glucose pyrophosphorylase